MKPFLYVRALRKVDHSVFSVADGQKFYRDPVTGARLAYSSGQQVKRSVMDYFTSALNTAYAPVTFNWTINKEEKAEQGEAWSLCDPAFPDQLIGGYMKAEKGELVIKRRSPLSISAMRPLHPRLGGLEDGGEAMSFDRSSYADRHKVNVFRIAGEKDKRELLSEQEVQEWLSKNDRSLPPKKWIEPQKRASGLFVYDIAIDLRTLFCVSTNQFEPEMTPQVIEKLKAEGWVEGENVFGRCLICPAEKRTSIIDALAEALLNWRITSNQSRTFSVMETLAIAISDNANQIAYAIRAEIDDESGETVRANPVIDETAKAKIYLAPPISGVVKGEKGSAQAVENAAEYLKEQMMAFPYEKQIV
jgi:hypothetical protein